MFCQKSYNVTDQSWQLYYNLLIRLPVASYELALGSCYKLWLVNNNAVEWNNRNRIGNLFYKLLLKDRSEHELCTIQKCHNRIVVLFCYARIYCRMLINA